MAQEQLCTQCGTVAYMKRFMKGSLLTEIFLWFCALLPGLIYSIWRHSTVYWGCQRCDNPTMIPLASPVAQKFLAETKPGQPISAYRVPDSGTGMSARTLVVVLIVIAVLGAIVRINTVVNEAHPKTSVASFGNTDLRADADQLIKNCGPPFKDDSTAYDSPRPPIVTRFVEYKVKGTHLRFIYVPGNGHVGDPPPYDWKLQMVANVRTNKLYNHDQVSNMMWCTAALPGPRLIAKSGN